MSKIENLISVFARGPALQNDQLAVCRFGNLKMYDNDERMKNNGMHVP